MLTMFGWLVGWFWARVSYSLRQSQTHYAKGDHETLLLLAFYLPSCLADGHLGIKPQASILPAEPHL